MKDGDYDHVIDMVDEEHRRGRSPSPPMTPSAGPVAAVAASEEAVAPTTESRLVPEQNAQPETLAPVVEREDLYQDAREDQTPRQSLEAATEPDTSLDDSQDDPKAQVSGHSGHDARTPDTDPDGPSIEVQGPTPLDRDALPTNGTAHRPTSKHDTRETEIDILWENERGCFLCGAALFASAALGNLDPSPWTNQYHKTSPTDIRTAQVPDPTWEWAWPEWRVNREEGVAMDEFGWEYSFMFAKKFSWHGPKWWNSFVRRRAWIRKRVKKRPEDLPSDPHMLNTDYFNITPARSRSSSVSSARGGSVNEGGGSVNGRHSMGHVSNADSILEEKPDIEDIWVLLMVLRAARIDREKIEAVENYLGHAQDGLEDLKSQMSDIMGIFVFQASRRILLSRLTQLYEEMGQAEKEGGEGASQIAQKRKNLGDAIKHADAEVKRLSFWSDIKKVTEGGVSQGAADEREGWDEAWEGVDQSGPAPLNRGKLP